MGKLKIQEPEYIVVADNIPFLPKGTKLIKEVDTYFTEDESVILKSTNYTGKVIKKICNIMKTVP